MSKITEFCNALTTLGDGRYHYWNGSSGVGCSDYVRMALALAGVITNAEANDSTNLWAGQGYRKILLDTTRFTELPASTTPQKGDIYWYNGKHVSVCAGGSDVWEAAPEASHDICSNGKTGVGLWKNHKYNCSGGALTCIYRIKENGSEGTEKMIKSADLVKVATDVCMGVYGSTGYWNTYPWNVGKYGESKWWFDCLGFVHTMVNGFCGNRNLLGGGAVMDEFVNCCDEAATLKTCTTYSVFNGAEPKKGELLQSSGHVGIYIGEYKVTRSNGTVDIYNTAECTPIWGGGCLLSYTDVNNGYRYNKKGGEYRSTWNYHGQLGRVDYSDQNQTVIMEEPVEAAPATVLTPAEKLQTAIDVINNKWGCNPSRKEALTKAYGSEVAVQIQELVNKAFE